jgi:hypothetical protein
VTFVCVVESSSQESVKSLLHKEAVNVATRER